MGATKENLSKSNSSSENTSPLQKKVPGLLSRLFFTWMFPLFYNGTKRDLEEYDLVPPKSLYDSKVVGDLLERKWIEEETAARLANRKPSFKKVLFRTFFWSYLPGGLMQFTYVFARTGAPLLFAELLTYWSAERAISQTTAAYYAGSMIAIYWVAALFNHHGDIYCKQYGMKMRIATSTLMFRKIMRMDNGSLGDTTAGKVVNLLSNDLQRMDLAFLFLHYVWIIPLQMIAICYLGYLQAGYAALIGFAALIIIALPIQGGLGRLIGKARGRVAKTTDERIKVMSEVISGIQVIKMYAWEIPFEKVVGEKRAAEIKEVRFTTLLRAIFIGFMVFTDKTVIFLTILTLVLSGSTLSATVIYPIQQFVSAAQVNITLILPLVLSFTAELFVSLKRIEEFLHKADRPDLKLSPESMSRKLFRDTTKTLTFDDDVKSISYRASKSPSLGQHNKGFKNDEKQFLRTQSFPGDVAVEVRDVSCSWIGDPNVLALKNISLRVRSGKLCAVIGAVGSGKSSFLQMLLKELPVASGNFSVYGKISYACQEAWLFPSTVRENILFGLPFDPVKYKKVCKACALEKDFKQFPFGDQSLVGERGTSLSGGQRARINLARAVYREADVYLLDDPLSAVDANVGRQLFEGCINGYLRNKTRILVTHQIHFLRAADYIVVLNKGSVENMGTFEELVSSEKEFATILASLQEGKDKDSESMASTGSDSNRKELARSISRTISRTISTSDDDEPQHEAQKMADEERQSGNLKFEVVMAYFKTGGGFISIMTLFIILCSTVAAAGAEYWVSFWTNEIELAQANNNGTQIESGLDVVVGRFTTGQYLLIQGGIVAVCILLVQIRSFPFTTLCMNASRRLHNQMFANMLRGVMRFFDTSSSGRILNRFTKDMGAIDEMLPRSLLDVLQIFSNLISVLVLNAIALYWTLIPSSVLFVIFTLFIMVYLRTAQAVKRLEGTTKSPVFGMVTSALNGISTIRACGAEQTLIQQFDEHQDLHTAAWNDYLGGGSAFGFYLDTICLVYLASVIFVFIYIDFGNLIAVGTVGLAVTQSNGLTAILQHGARMLVEYIAQLTSVERVLEYTKIPTEDHLFHGSEPTRALWPSQGEIVFKNVYLRYAPEEAPVLKNLNIHIQSGWKVGIVGRTGAGKSSLISAMFRFANLEGTMTIDGVDTALLAKQELRQKISIIPQEPVLFSATIRYNLDPFGIYSDKDLWRALEQVDMKKAVPSLDLKVTEGGSNFSVGQRQLMCLARAVLRSNKILIMDEATANVDPQTDNFIQQTIRRQFATCTVLTIAHRLNTIMDSDRVLVMDSGEVAEFDHPYLLLSDANSHFSSMVRETGDKMANTLLEAARQAYYQSNQSCQQSNISLWSQHQKSVLGWQHLNSV